MTNDEHHRGRFRISVHRIREQTSLGSGKAGGAQRKPDRRPARGSWRQAAPATMLHRNKAGAIEIMDLDDPYHELGLAPGSSDAEVKVAWRRLSARWHPDRNNSSHALRKIQRINRALEMIRNARDEPKAETEDPASDAEKSTIEHTINLTLEEVVSGCVREVRGEVAEDCAECSGSGLQLQAMIAVNAVAPATQDAATNTEQYNAWQTIQRSHAVANGVHVVSVNRVGFRTRGQDEILGWILYC